MLLDPQTALLQCDFRTISTAGRWDSQIPVPAQNSPTETALMTGRWSLSCGALPLHTHPDEGLVCGTSLPYTVSVPASSKPTTEESVVPFKNIRLGAEEVGQRIKYLLCKREDPSSIPRTLIRKVKLGVLACACNPVTWRADTGRSLGSQITLTYLVSFRLVRVLVITKKMGST